MKLEELKQRSWLKVLLRGKSGRGKTDMCGDIILGVLQEGGSVLAIDTESELATTLLDKIDKRGLDEDVIDELEYVQAGDYDELMTGLERQGEFDLIVIDTLDHKHSYVLKSVTDKQNAADVDWNEYPRIYNKEKQVMEIIGKPSSNIVATLDPDSGKIDKPKGTQTNIHGYFSVVVDLSRSNDEWHNRVTNWVGKSEVIGKQVDNLEDALVNEISTRIVK